MRRARYLKSAERNFRDLFRYLARETGDRAYARTLAERLRKQCSKLASLEGTLGRPRPELGERIRRFPHKGYVIFFRYERDEFVVISVLHSHRDIVAYFANDQDREQD